MIAQHDGIAAFGTRFTTSWQPNERILDKHRLELPPEMAGRNGRMFVGLYHSETVERQQFDNGEEALWLGNFVLVPAE